MKNFITPAELAAAQESYIIFDCRADLMNGNYGKEAFAKSRIAGAFFIDMNEDMSQHSEPGAHGGRHPLPDMETLAVTLAACGVSNDSKIVVYDDWLFAAARLWWMIKYIGVRDVKVLAGGLRRWQQEGYPLDETPLSVGARSAVPLEKVCQGQLQVELQKDLLATHDMVQTYTKTGERLLVDVRGGARYRGETEPMDRIAGHIPSAINVYYEEPYTEQGLKDLVEVRRVYESVLAKDKTPVVYCGSGISAPVSILAMEEVGLAPILYAGSYSDWVSYEDCEIKTGEE